MPCTTSGEQFNFGEKHTEYIKNNLQTLQKKCQQFSACTQELYSAENYHSILGGESTRLTNICGLMFANGGGHYTTLKKECTEKERRAIRQTIGDKLDGKFNLGREQLNSSWVKLWKCVTDSKGDDDETVETVCRLKTSNAGNLCGDEDVNSMTRTFFNHELEHVHCSCLALESFSDQGRPRFPKPARIAIVGGVALLLVVLIIAVVVLCLRHRKTKRKLKDHKMRSVKESAARIDPEEPSAVYHEIEDVAPKLPSRPQPARGEGKLLPYGYQLGFAPPPPAERYIKGKHLPRGGSGHRSPRDDDDHRPHSYMEPLPDPIPVGLGAQGPTAAGLEGAVTSPYSLARRVEDSERADPASPSGGYSLAGRMDGVPSIVVTGAGSGSTEGTYFDTIRLSRARAEEDEFGYYAKLKSPPGGSSGDATDITTEDENHTPPEAQYFELEPQAGDAEHLERAYSALASTKL
ncbi:uncharacterized protein LOC143292430 isoform X2 [Babylonia areolata]|uniref:uncharacterized protein LOC143292430 isoform X2 n=1 Tax=Babylonia areolata TaxID=304850 RepID=UPI003FD4E53B